MENYSKSVENLWKTILYIPQSSLHLVENYSCFIALRHKNSLYKPIRYYLSVRLIIRYILAVRAYLSLRLMIRCLYLTSLWVHYTTPHKVCYLNQPVLYYSWYSVSDINWCRPLSIINTLWVRYTTPHKVCYSYWPALYYSCLSVRVINWCPPFLISNPPYGFVLE